MTRTIGGDAAAVSRLEKIFARPTAVHVQSMLEISTGLTMARALQVVEQKRLMNSSMLGEMQFLLSGAKQLRYGKHKKPGYSGIDGARKMLNDMIFESLSKYDAEIAKCTDYYSRQCGLMEICRGQIAASNYVAANSRMLILDSQATINKCEADIPETKLELKNHNSKCKNELKKLNSRLKIVMGDIAVMTMILKMTDCETKLLQTSKLTMLHCKDACTGKTFVKFNHKGLQHQVDQLTSSHSQGLLKTTVQDLFEGCESMEGVEFVQVAGSDYQQPVVNKTQFNNPPLPRTAVPGNPCTDPDKGAPSAADKRAAKCTIKKSPQCYKLQSRFLSIQAGIQDERDGLLDDISKLEESCETTKNTLETVIQNDAASLSSSQTKLAVATEKEAGAGEMARTTTKEHSAYNDDLLKQMKTCSGNYINFETELCALRKIRGELYKMKGSGHSAFFADCEVSKWEPEECSKKCAGGTQKLKRSVLTHAAGGAKCLPLSAMTSCNNGPCPVNCKISSWSGWSKCSAKCGGGVTQRLRDVKQAMRHGGTPCGETSEAKACNGQSCEKDCELSAWTKWSSCSKDCDGGTLKRQKFIKVPAEGAGKCAGDWHEDRLQYKKCNMDRCKVPDITKALKCNKTMDYILVLDGSPRSGKKGFVAQMQAANNFIDAMSGPGVTSIPNIALVRYSGPRTWSGISKCTGKGGKKKVDPEKDCGIKIVSHFEEDMKKVKSLITGLEFRKGSKLLALALLTAKAELGLGRKTAASNVVVFLDGAPLSIRKTMLASRVIRKSARLHWVVVTKFAPLKDIKTWATRRWQENIVQVQKYTQLQDPQTVTHVIANICPSRTPKLKMGRP